jgi:hypothetical protein
MRALEQAKIQRLFDRYASEQAVHTIPDMLTGGWKHLPGRRCMDFEGFKHAIARHAAARRKERK